MLRTQPQHTSVLLVAQDAWISLDKLHDADNDVQASAVTQEPASRISNVSLFGPLLFLPAKGRFAEANSAIEKVPTVFLNKCR